MSSALAKQAAARLLGGVVLLLVLSVVTFLLVHLAPGDVVTDLLGVGPGSRDTAAREALAARWHLDDSLWSQYWSWLGHLLRGDWGTSIHQQRPVAQVLRQRTGLTVELVGLALLLSVVVGVPLGALSAKRAGSRVDQLVGAVAVAGVSAPAFAVSFMLIYLFGFELHWLPLYGPGGGGLDRLRHLLLPAAALAIGLGAYLLKITRSVLIRELDQDYVTSARARGWSERRVLLLGLRNATVPLVTSAALTFSYLIAGTILVEQVFALPGLGRTLYDAVAYKDIALVQGTTLVIAAFIIVVTLVADLAGILLDPRVRRDGRTAR